MGRKQFGNVNHQSRIREHQPLREAEVILQTGSLLAIRNSQGNQTENQRDDKKRDFFSNYRFVGQFSIADVIDGRK